MNAAQEQSFVAHLRDAWRRAAHGLRVPEAYRAQQESLVRGRIRSLAPVIAWLVVGWIPDDAIGLDWSEFARIVPMRVGLATALFLLAYGSGRLPARAALMTFVWLQVVAFAAMQLCLHATGDNVLRIGYGLFPFAVAAQLGVFPLPWAGVVRIALSAIALLFVPAVFNAQPLDATFLNDLWLLSLILSLAAWASHVQLRLLIDLLGARRDASHDALTGLANRRSAEQRLAADCAHAQRQSEPLSVLMLDLDHFKHVNDRWGHACGDRVLIATAKVLLAGLRGADLAVRYGGEEFLAVLPATDAAQAIDVAERIREGIARATVPLADHAVRVTASIGVATLAPDERARDLVGRADAALYLAKSMGRNRVQLAPQPVSSTRAPEPRHA